MRIYFVETEQSDEEVFAEALQDHELHFVSELKRVEIDAEILSIFIQSTIDASFLDQHQKIKLIVTRSTGHDHIDISECEKRSIVVCFVPSYADNTVVQHTFALILALSRRNREAREACRAGRFTYEGTRGFDLNGKTLGVIGTGKIGLRVIRLATAFEMEVVAYDIHRQSKLEEVLGFRYVSLDQLLGCSHIISLHAPLTPATYHLLDRERFSKCRPGVLIINTARGRLIDTDSLREALDQGIVAGAGLDVIEEERVMVQQWSTVATQGIIEHIRSESQEEPRIVSSDRIAQLRALMYNADLIGRPNVVFTPHIAFNSVESVKRINQTTVENINAFLAGQPVNVVGKMTAAKATADNATSAILTRAPLT
jgi:D-lactate dehydrogenase